MIHPTTHPLKRVALLLFATAICTIAQQPADSHKPAPTSDATTLKVSTRLTRVDVTVTDSKGQPVHGLTQADFTVKEDGKSQPLKNFEEFGTEKPAPSEAPPKLPPNIYTNAQPQSPSTEAVNVLLVDDVTTGSGLRMVPENVATSRNQATKYLQTMAPGTQVILLELADRLRVIQGLTTDRDVLLAALHSISYRQNVRTSMPPCGAELASRGPGPMTSTPCMVPLTDACGVANAQSQTVIDALDNASTYLSGIKGRKNLIWFTPGIPWLTNYTAYDAIVCLRDYTAALQRDYNLLAAAQVALYPVDPGGVAYTATIGIYPFEPRIPPPPPGAPGPDDHISMEDLADATGGQAYYNTNDLAAAIGKVVATGTDYYSLYYVPPLAKYDGQYHKIEVTVRHPDIRLIYRKGYSSIDPAKLPQLNYKALSNDKTPPDAMLSAAIGHGVAPSTQVLFTVGIDPSAVKPKGDDAVLGQLNPKLKLKHKSLVRYDFNYKVLPGDITLTDAPDGKRQASVEFTVAAYDGRGEMLNVRRQTASFTVEPNKLARFLAHPFPVLLQLDLPPGNIFIRAVVRDVPSGKSGSLEIPVDVVP